MMHHLLSVRFIVLLLMCLFLVPLTLSINYQQYRQNLVDYQEAVKLANIEETTVNPSMELKPKMEISKLFLKPTPLSTFANGLADALPSYLGMTRNGVTHGPPALVSASLAYLLGHLDFLSLSEQFSVYLPCCSLSMPLQEKKRQVHSGLPYQMLFHVISFYGVN